VHVVQPFERAAIPAGRKANVRIGGVRRYSLDWF
jgi:hypothetical protein